VSACIKVTGLRLLLVATAACDNRYGQEDGDTGRGPAKALRLCTPATPPSKVSGSLSAVLGLPAGCWFS